MAHEIFEQIVEEYLTHQGYFVQHNVKFKPSSRDPDYVADKDRVNSDIDVLAYNPRLVGRPDCVLAVNVKSWQAGFDIRQEIRKIEANKLVRGKDSTLKFRELTIPKWAKAYRETIQHRTQSQKFTHMLAVTRLVGKGTRSMWENHPKLTALMGGNPLRVITLTEMVEDIEDQLTHTLAPTDLGRMLQLFLAAGLRTKRATPVSTPVSQ